MNSSSILLDMIFYKLYYYISDSSKEWIDNLLSIALFIKYFNLIIIIIIIIIKQQQDLQALLMYSSPIAPDPAPLQEYQILLASLRILW